MKLKPCLILTSLSVLLCQAQVTDAQQPQPRFGYGSLPGGAYVIPPPKVAPRPATSTKPEAKASKTPAAKAKTVVKTAPKTTTKSPAKPTPSKPAVAGTKMKPSPPKAIPARKNPPTKAVAATKSKTRTATPAKPPAKSPVRTVVANATPRPAAKVVSRPEPARTVASRPQPALPRPAANPPKAVSARAVVTVVPPPHNTSTTNSSTLNLNRSPKALGADRTAAPDATGFHFFGVPVILPDVPAASYASTSGRGSHENAFVDVGAARQALGGDKNPNRYTKADPAAQSTAQPAMTHLAPTSVEPAGLGTEDHATASSDASISTDDLYTTRSVPASLDLAAIVPDAAEPALETTTLDEPALPAPVISKPLPSEAVVTAVTEEPSDLEPALPRETPAPSAPASRLASAADDLAEEHDLSERERAFVRSLAEAAGSVTSASGPVNKDLPRTIASAASALMDQVPAETATSFRAAARSAGETVNNTVQDAVPGLPMEISNDLMPATPEKMPDRLPDFNAAPSGKIDVQSDRQADYDQANNKVIFTGKVELNSAAIRLRAERVEVFMKKGGGGMERVEASGNVLMRTQDTENGPGQMASAGRTSYNLKTGEITLSDWPKIQESGKSHVSTDPSTKMYMFTDGRLRTDGPNRTLIGGMQ